MNDGSRDDQDQHERKKLRYGQVGWVEASPPSLPKGTLDMPQLAFSMFMPWWTMSNFELDVQKTHTVSCL